MQFDPHAGGRVEGKRAHPLAAEAEPEHEQPCPLATDAGRAADDGAGAVVQVLPSLFRGFEHRAGF